MPHIPDRFQLSLTCLFLSFSSRHARYKKARGDTFVIPPSYVSAQPFSPNTLYYKCKRRKKKYFYGTYYVYSSVLYMLQQIG